MESIDSEYAIDNVDDESVHEESDEKNNDEKESDILNNLIDLYKMSYMNLNRITRWLATTHFQLIYVKRVHLYLVSRTLLQSVFQNK